MKVGLNQELKKIADEEGYTLNPDKSVLNEILEGLLKNELRYGYRSCPCRLASGILVEDQDIICPCEYRDADLAEYGCCFCTLYVTEDYIKGKKPHIQIPERRQTTRLFACLKKGEEKKKITNSSKIFVWRCTVCGYLCARAQPPNICPICRAKKERFEKFTLK